MIGNILLGIFLIMWGLVISLHLPVPMVFLGVLAVVGWHPIADGEIE